MKYYLFLNLLLCSFLADAANREQRCKQYKVQATPSTDFIINNNGTVTHKTTGLIWKRCVEGMSGQQCAGKMEKHYGEDVLIKDTKFPHFASNSNWRVPSIEELKSITENQCKYPALNDEVFPNAPSVQHWSSSRDENSEDTVWVMYVSSGHPVKLRLGVKLAVRLVRDPS